jgi:hypothetical protein
MRLLCLVVVLSLSGCAVVQQVQLQHDLKSAMAQCEGLYVAKELDPIRDKVPVANFRDATFAMRTNTNYPTDAEKQVIALWAQKRDECNKIAEPVLTRLPDQEVAIFEAMHQVGASLVAKLYLRQLTYGQFSDQAGKAYAEGFKALADVDNALKVQSQQAQAEAAMIANQAIANLNGFAQTQALQQMQMQMNRPTVCHTYGNTTTCM